MFSGSDPDDRYAGLPAWLPWFQLGLTAMLTVLFLVLLSKEREQGRALMDLETRMRALENSHRLDRGAAVEQQLRVMTQRLLSLERQGAKLEAVEAQQQQLEQEILQLRSPLGGLPVPPAPVRPTPQARPAEPPPPPPRPAPPPLRQGTSVLRPPNNGNY